MHERDIARLAELHVSCLDDSFVASLGPGYVKSFYRYVTRSPKEITAVERSDAGAIVAAAVVSLEPATLPRRLLLHTSLLARLLTHPGALVSMLRARANGGDAAGASAPQGEVPEMILIYTDAAERGRGRGTALLAQVESRLRQIGIAAYQVKTVASPSNPALAFYRGREFTPAGRVRELGRTFELFTRRL